MPPCSGRASGLMVLLGLLLSFALPLCLSQPPAVLHLTDADFEHKTQASTGQTTGSWCVLFTGKDQRIINILWEKLAVAQQEGASGLLFGQVTVDSSPDLAERFEITKTNIPTARLFTDRKMHKYTGPQEASTAIRDAFEQFCLSPGSPAVEVPKPKSALDKPLSELLRDLILRLDNLPNNERFGVYGIIVAVFIVLWVLARGLFIRLPYEKMELQAKKGR